VPADQDCLTVAEVLGTIRDAAWSELDADASRRYSEREPMVSSFRRNLQREHLERLIDLSMGTTNLNAASMPVKTLAVAQLRDLLGKLEKRLEKASNLDAYTLAHFGEAKTRIERALEAQYIYNADQIGGGGIGIFLRASEQAKD
jgi:hypothetical protein